MADRRRQSPEGFGKRRKDYKPSDHDERPRMRSSVSSSSSSSSSYIDISRTFPSRTGLRAFFTTPSERRKLRKRRSSRLLKLDNSSSSSVNSDLAYGTGFVKRSKLRRVKSRQGKDIDRERHRDYVREKERSGVSRGTTDAEILAIGAGLAKIARDQNKRDMRGGRTGNISDIYSVKQSSSSYDNGASRGLGSSKIDYGPDAIDEDGWESASDAGSESSVDSKLAFGSDMKGGWFGWGIPKHKPQSRKSSVVDPALFGPANSLHGLVTEPVGFGDVSWSSTSDFGQSGFTATGPVQSVASGSQVSLQHVYPIPTNDPSRFEAARGSIVSGAEPFIYSRPAPIPLQQPQPMAPVSQSVYEPSYATRGEPEFSRRPSSPSGRKSLAEAALMGVAGAAIGAAISSEHKDDRSSKRREGERRGDKDDRRRETRDSSDRKERRREKNRSKDTADQLPREKKRDKPREDQRDDGREERREKRREERRSERSEDRYETRRTKSEASIATTAVDPFQYQVDDDAFSTPTPSTPVHSRITSVPTVVTVERVPVFARDQSSSIKDQAGSFDRSDPRKADSKWDEREQRYRDRDSRDRSLRNAEAIYEETEHSTAPIEVAAIGAAVAAVAAEGYRESRSDRRRDERRSDRDRRKSDGYDSSTHTYSPPRESNRDRRRSRDREPERDPIQEEADRAYREIIMARKIASQVIRSRTPSPDRSVVHKYDHSGDEKEEIIRIVTPPAMEEHKKEGPYDAPNADFTLDLVMDHPRELRTFKLPSINLEGFNGGLPQKDPDATEPRPLLNLVRPTPTPSPMPEKQAARSEAVKRPKPESQESSVPTSDIIINDEGDPVPSPLPSPASKGVTWGENQTKHYEVESPHKDDSVSNPDIRTRDDASQQSVEKHKEVPIENPKPSTESRRGAWGAIAAGIIGANAAVAGSSESPNTTETKENEKDGSYEYRGVVVEPETTPVRKDTRSPPATGPKPSAVRASHIPGAFDDDLDFTATVAAGLQDTGFDPNIVIDDPSFMRRESPPGSNQPGIYRAPFAETVSDLGSLPRSVSPEKEEFSIKLSKKEQKKLEKGSRRKSGDVAPIKEEAHPRETLVESDSYFEPAKLSRKDQKKRDKLAQRQGNQSEAMTPSVAEELVEEPESYFETPEKPKSKESKRQSSTFDGKAGEKVRGDEVSVPVDTFEDLRNGQDEWMETKKSKKKSKRESEGYDSQPQSIPPDISPILGRSTSKKSKDKSRRKSEQYEPIPEPTDISLPPSTPSENSRDGAFDEIRESRKSSKSNSTDRDDSRSIVSADASRYTDESSRKSKKKSRSGRDDSEDTRSVASAPVGEDFDEGKKSKKKEKRSSGGFFGLFGTKSDSGTKEESLRESKDDLEEIKTNSKKSKRNPVVDDLGICEGEDSQTVKSLSRVSSNGNGHAKSTEQNEDPNREDSFLAKAGTLGAGVGLAGAAAAAIAARHHQQSKADENDNSERSEETPSNTSMNPQQQAHEILDPEITQRQFRPSIDPQYGDLLPLPPSDPASPNVEPIDDLPGLPDSRPDTPDAERLLRDKSMGSVRKSLQEAPMKSPSQSSVPLKFIMSNRSTPSSPGVVRSSPMQSPATPKETSLAFPRTRPRPTSWDSTKEYKPLYLVESNRRASIVHPQEQEEQLPALPLSQSTSRSSSQLDLENSAGIDTLEQSHFDEHLVTEAMSIDVHNDSTRLSQDILDSQQSTPKLEARLRDIEPPTAPLSSTVLVEPIHTKSRSLTPESEDRPYPNDGGVVPKPLASQDLVSSIGYFPSSPNHNITKKSWLDELPSRSSVIVPLSLIEPISKERSSHLLQSSPSSKSFEDDKDLERSINSSVGHQLFSFSDGETVRSIQEREGDDIFGQFSQSDSGKSREMPPDTMAGMKRDITVEQNKDYVSTHTEPEKTQLPDQGLTPTSNFMKLVSEVAEEELLLKGKANKKRQKNKVKVLSGTSDIDETVDEEAAGDTPTSMKREGSQNFPPTTVKEYNENKDPSRSLITDDISSLDPVQEIREQLRALEDHGQAEEFSSTMSKKGQKEKRKSKSGGIWKDLMEDTQQKPPITLREDTPTEAANILDRAPAAKKGKKDKKKAKSADIWDEAGAATHLQNPSTNFNDIAYPEGSTVDGDWTPTAKKTQKAKKKGKSGLSWTPQEEVAFVPQATSKSAELDGDRDGDCIPKSNLNTDVSNLASEFKEDHAAFPISQTPLVESADDYEILTSRKSKKKDKKSRASSPRGDPASQAISEPNKAIEEPVMPNSKLDALLAGKTPELSARSRSLALEAEPAHATISELQSAVDDVREATKEESTQTVNLVPDQNLPMPKPTPTGGPGAWPVTPVTPWTNAGYKTSESSSKDYFPSTAGLHSPKNREISDDTTNSGYFPSARALFPFRPTILESVFSKKRADNLDTASAKINASEAPEDPPSNLPRDFDSSEISREGAQPAPLTPDGIKAGYDLEQLSLAKRLQEEFGGGNKTSKKGKKKRHSLPATPGPELPRSETLDGGTIVHPRARSLSIDHSVFPEQKDEPSSSQESKSQYTEEQLELARQLKADYTSVAKRSKKDKRKPARFPSRTPTQDDWVADQPSDALKSIEPDDVEQMKEANLDENNFQADGLAAGYKEDQLSLARQLQAEFGSGSKKSKKENKRRSASQTPVSGAETINDYFGQVYLSADQKTPQADSLVNISNPAAVDQTPLRDGPAVGYSEDQLELAKQLKEEFGSGHQKSKKNTIRQSLSQGVSDVPHPRIVEPTTNKASEFQHLNSNDPTNIIAELAEQQDPEAKDEFGIKRKKTRKDKKPKKSYTNITDPGVEGTSSVSASRDEGFSGARDDASQFDSSQTSKAVLTSNELQEGPTPPEDDNKLHSSHTRTPDESSSDDFARQVEALHNVQSANLSNLGTSTIFLPDDWSQKSPKEDKSAPSIDLLQDVFESLDATRAPILRSSWTILEGDTKTWKEFEKEVVNPSDPPSKESENKQKTRKELDTYSNLTSLPEAEVVERDQELESIADIATPGSSSNGIELGAKKSKKEKKKSQNTAPTRGGLAATKTHELGQSPERTSDMNHQVLDSTNQDLAAKDEAPLLQPTENITFISEDSFNGDSARTTKKSEKYEKKQKALTPAEIQEPPESPSSLYPLSVPLDLAGTRQPTQPFGGKQAADELPLKTVINDFTVPLESTKKESIEQKDDEWEKSSSKMSKKDKRKGNSGVSTPLKLETPIIGDTNMLVEFATKEVVDEPDDEWGAFSIKKSKKDKKNANTNLPGPGKQTLPLTEPAEALGPSDTTLSATTVDILAAPSKIDTAELNDRWEEFPIKKSKKNKKTKKSSSLTEPVGRSQTDSLAEPAIAPEIENIFHSNDEKSVHDLAIGQDDEVPARNREEELIAKLPGSAAKTLKKEKKKKRKSGLSTPLEETIPLENSDGAVHHVSSEDSAIVTPEFDNTTSGTVESSPTIKAIQSATQRSLTSEAPEDASGLVLDSGDAGPLIAQAAVANPVPLDKERLIEDPLPGTEGPTKSVESLVTGNIERKASKKDKRKRQNALDNPVEEGSLSTNAPLTSWAEEVEEAGIERSHPVMEDISKNESLSHIPSTTETDPIDDFTRPTKKGKKGKKRDLTKKTPVLNEESLNSSTSSKRLEDESEDIILSSTAVGAMTGAALLAGSASDHPLTGDANAITPPRKLSKKEKKKISIDRRSALHNDLFDDPSLWEGEKPSMFEEPGVMDDDPGGDDFWTTPLDEGGLEKQDTPTKFAGLEEKQPSDGEPPEIAFPSSLSPVSRSQIEGYPGDQNHGSRESLEPIIPHVSEREITTKSAQLHEAPESEERPPNNLVHEFVRVPSREEKQNSIPVSEWSFPHDMAEPIAIQTSAFPLASNNEVPRNIDEQLPQHKSHSDGPLLDRKMVSSAETKNLVEESHIDERGLGKSLPVENDPVAHLNTSHYSHSGSSSLPAVREESPPPMKFNHTAPRYPQAQVADDNNRDSAFITESPIPRQSGFTDDHEHIRDSGVHLRDFSPAPVSATDDALARMSWPAVNEETETVDLHISQRPRMNTSPVEHGKTIDKEQMLKRSRDEKMTALHQTSTKNQAGGDHHDTNDRHHSIQPIKGNNEKRQQNIITPDILNSPYDTKPAKAHDYIPVKLGQAERVKSPQEGRDLPSQRRTEIVHGSLKAKEGSSVMQRVERIESPDSVRSQRLKQEKYAGLNTSPRPKAERHAGFNESSVPAGATMGFAAARQSSREQRPGSVGSNRSSSNVNRLRTPDPKLRPDSVTSHRSSGTPPLRRSDGKSGDLRSLSQHSKHSKPDLAKEAELAAAALTLTLTANPTANEGRVRAKDMADVYDGFGEGRMGSPRSPTRPHSMRRRQSMQVLDLESRLEQLAAENRMLAEAKVQAERTLQTTQHNSSSLVEREAEIDSLKRTLDWLQNEVTRLTEVNDGLASANITLGNQQNDRYGILETQHLQATRELQDLRESHNTLSAEVEQRVNDQLQLAVQDKDQQIAHLRAQLDAAKEQIRDMQRQILASKTSDSEFLTIRDEDYFDTACQQLCQHVQQWVLRFSKFSDMRACRLTSEINNDKIIDRLDNAILDGSDVDSYLADRVKRRDVFMSMTMTMVWEFVFTRYLFGMDREQRQKLKSLEKLLSEVGPAAAVHQWRATTLTLLSKREAFVQQREQDTLAVVNAVLETLTEILPPPSHLEDQIQEQLVRVMKAAVDLSIEMRTQRAEYMMLPPLQPEYDANGDLASKVSFNAALMNERSGDTVSNEELEESSAIVRIVLFPLVVKKGDDSGEGDEEIVVCPAQVLVAKPKKSVRVFTPESLAHQNHSRVSMQSSMPADYGEHSVI